MAVAASDSDTHKRKLPPMLEEYCSYQRKFSDHIIFFQVGDFYEVFFEKARLVAKVLNLTLTSRDKNAPDPIPMCGVPIGSIEGYIERLLDAGYSAALVSQVVGATPLKKGAPVERTLERVVTPGVRLMTAGDERAGVKNTILAVGVAGGERSAERMSLAWGTAGSGAIQVMEGVAVDEILEAILRVEPGEVVLPGSSGNGPGLSRRIGWVKDLERRLPPQALRFRTVDSFRQALNSERFAQTAQFSLLGVSAKKAVRLYVQFIDEATVSESLPLDSVQLYERSRSMVIDTMTRKNLELLQTARDGSFEGSLYHFMKETVTAGGSRLLREWLMNPLVEAEPIQSRQEAVSLLVQNYSQRAEIRDRLSTIPDLERLAARAELLVISPRELAALRDGLNAIQDLNEQVFDGNGKEIFSVSTLLRKIISEISVPLSVRERLQDALTDTPPLQPSDGDIIREGYSEDIDRYRKLSRETNEFLVEFQEKERGETGIPSLKVKSNNAIGLFIEITKTHASKAPDHYIPRQTLTNGARFTTKELREWEQQLNAAQFELQRLEYEIFQDLRLAVKECSSALRALHQSISELDVLSSLAHTAEEQGFTAPKLISGNATLQVRGGWHPILRSILKERCITNDLELNQDTRCLVLTGPNMGGKSTYLRQSGILLILAQIGSFVPAEEMSFAIFDRIFARLGASDDLHEGESTFMIEMKEAANITSYATKNSLVLVDEIGRGTATVDGISIARAILEWITEQIQCRCLFATHYHQLTKLADQYSAVDNISVQVQERDNEVIFTHHVLPGAADRSYGIEVADRAGLPKSLLLRAKELLRAAAEEEQGVMTDSAQLSIFSSLPTSVELSTEESRRESEIQQIILEHTPDDLTPRQALELFYELYETCRKD